MRLVRLGPVGAEVPHVLVGDDAVVDVSDVTADFDERFFGSGAIASLAGVVEERIAAGHAVPVGDRRMGSPIARPHQVIAIGLNYSDHAAETNQVVPDEPLVFTKAPNTVVGPYDTVHVPRGSTKCDWEVELGVVVGRRCRYLANQAEAEEAIAGYVLVHDVSERSFQLERGGQWVKGKSAETFNPCGPWLATPDEIGDVLDLAMWLDVNGDRRQTGSTSSMVFSPSYLVHYLSQFMVLEPGDLIDTGTPAGVGLGMTPPQFLRAGDVVELGIDGLGSQRQVFEAAP